MDIINVLSKNKKIEIILIWFYRVDLLFKEKENWEQKKKLRNLGVKIVCIPFISWTFPMSWWHLIFVAPQWFISLLLIRYIYKIRVLHCRSYHSGLIGAIGNKLFGVKYIFDPRSPFPEENVSSKIWKIKSFNYLYWKKIEKYLINNAVKVFLVSKSLLKEYQNNDKREKFVIVPNNYPLSFDIRYEMSLGNNDVTEKICYVGSFGHWNDYRLYLRLFKSIIREFGCIYIFQIITPKKFHKEIKNYAEKLKIPNDLIELMQVDQFDIAKTIGSSLAGIYLMSQEDSRLGVKTVEYLRAGIPVIVSRSIEGAVLLVEEENVGVIIDDIDDVNEIYKIKCFLDSVCDNKYEWKKKSQEVAINKFSPESVAGKIEEQYLEL